MLFDIRSNSAARTRYPEVVSGESKGRMDADLEVLMEQLRQRSHSMRSWNDLIKAARSNMKEKKSVLDAEDRSQLQQCLELLHKTADVRSSRELFEHIEEVAQKAGLSLAPSPSSPHCRFVMSECFFIEIQAKETGVVDKVFINHGQMASSKSSSLLVSLINERKWDDVVKQLEGLVKGYNVAGDKSSKIEAFNALQALEHSVDVFIGGDMCENVMGRVIRSPLGAFRQREAGRPSLLHFFLSPCDTLDVDEERVREPSVSELFDTRMGLWAELAMANSTDVISLVSSFRKDSGAGDESNGKNTATKISAVFSLKLSEPMVISTKTLALWDSVHRRTTVLKRGNYVELLQEVADCSSSEFNVILPDQRHIYVFDASYHQHLDAALVASVEFPDVNDLPSIVGALRNEALFASVLKSVLRENATDKKKRRKSGCRFELTCPRLAHIDCIFENSQGDGFYRVEFTAVDLDNLSVRVVDSNGVEDSQVENEGAKVFKRWWSIPVAMRSILKGLSVAASIADNDDDRNDPTEDEAGDAGEEEHQRDHQSDLAGDSAAESGGNVWPSFDAKSTYDSIYKTVCDSMPAFIDQQELQELSGVVLPHRQNLLDLFKEVDIWEALIPPKPGQKPLRSPAPQQKMRPVVLPPFPVQPGQQQTGAASSRSPKHRHMSTTSDTFEEMNELCNLSRAFAAENDSAVPRTPLGPPAGLAGTPVGEKAAPIGMERKSSIQDTIDSVLGSAMQPAPSVTPLSSSMVGSPIGPMGQTEARHRVSSGADRTATSMIHSFSFDQADAGGYPHAAHYHHSRSMSVAGTAGLSGSSASSTTTINLDVFDFDKADSMEMGGMEGGAGPIQRWHSFHDDSMGSPMFGMPPTGFVGQCDPQTRAPLGSTVAFRSALGAAARGAGRGRAGSVAGGRRRSRRALNVGDRSVEMALKELKKAERINRGASSTRRPRKTRGTGPAGAPSAHIVTSSFGEGDSPKVTLKIVQPQGNQNTGGAQEMLSPHGSFRPLPIQQQQQQQQQFGFHFSPIQQAQQDQDQSVQCKPAPAGPMGEPGPKSSVGSFYGAGEDSEDTAVLAKSYPDSYGGDEKLRQEIQALRQQMLSNVHFGSLDDRSSDAGVGGMEKTSEEAAAAAAAASSTDFNGGRPGGNLFENFATVAGLSQSESTVATAAGLSAESLMAKLRANVKRRSSLDSVIGKLMADKTAVATTVDEQNIFASLNELSGQGEIQQAISKRIRLDAGDIMDESEGASGMGVDEALMLVKKEESSNSPVVKDSGERTPEGTSSTGPEGIKLVIKKSAIKIPGSSGSGKSGSSKGGGGSRQQKTDKLSPGGTNLKRTSPNVTQQQQQQQQQQISGEQKQAAPSNKGFETLKQKMQEKKAKKQAAAKLAGEGERAGVKQGKGEKIKTPKVTADQPTATERKIQAAASSLVSDKTPPKSAPPTGVPGAEGILFSKSLKGFKIPKIDDSGGAKVTLGAPQGASPSKDNTAGRKPPFHPQIAMANMPKPILKHSGSVPGPSSIVPLMSTNSFVPITSGQPTSSSPIPTGRTELSPTFRPYMRRTLLPDPMEPTASNRPSVTFGSQLSLDSRYTAASGDFRDAYGTYGAALQEAMGKFTGPVGQSSPDPDGLVIDDNPKSPSAALNTSTGLQALSDEQHKMMAETTADPHS